MAQTLRSLMCASRLQDSVHVYRMSQADNVISVKKGKSYKCCCSIRVIRSKLLSAVGSRVPNYAWLIEKTIPYTLRISKYFARTRLIGQSNMYPTLLLFYSRLNEHPLYQWTPTLSALEFQTLLSDLTAIKIRGTYNTDGKKV